MDIHLDPPSLWNVLVCAKRLTFHGWGIWRLGLLRYGSGISKQQECFSTLLMTCICARQIQQYSHSDPLRYTPPNPPKPLCKHTLTELILIRTEICLTCTIHYFTHFTRSPLNSLHSLLTHKWLHHFCVVCRLMAFVGKKGGGGGGGYGVVYGSWWAMA